jgi:ATP-dependent helicase Lhr and Lhr-like helicase
MTNGQAIDLGIGWFNRRGWTPFPYQTEAWKAYLEGDSGMINAPTGTGKTYAMGLGIILEALMMGSKGKETPGPVAIWITPIRALATEIRKSIQQACDELGLEWDVAVRTGDTPLSEREKQKKRSPQFLITTPESLHLILASKGYQNIFSRLQCVVADEWHELLGTKRAVQLELALSRLKKLSPSMRIWGISATIGNLQEGLSVLLGYGQKHSSRKLIRGSIKKEIETITLLPDEIEKYPWAGHLGIRMLEKVIPVIKSSTTTLLFTNTRSQAEIWYQRILEHSPDLAGLMALHHGSISREIRNWVEEALHDKKLKLVVCTSSLDLGVDFRPVETIIQVGSPKGVARFIQRAGRSGHQPGAVSRIYFVPTHSLELVEAAALRQGIREEKVESRQPYIRSFDVLIQYLTTLAVSEGFAPEEIYPEIRSTYSYQSLSKDEWNWVLNFISTGGESLHAYEEYQKIEVDNGIYKIKNQRFAMRHRLSIGTIVGDNILQVKYLSGKLIGTIEESFISRLNPGDVFWFAGKSLEFIRVNGVQAFVRRTREKKGRVPSWMGGRMPLSSQMSALLRENINKALTKDCQFEELVAVRPLIEKQQAVSHVPGPREFLIEKLETREGFHIFMYPFEGRFVHEGLASLLAFRIASIRPLSFSIALNDYGFELLSDQEIPIEDALELDLFTADQLIGHLQASLNATEMARARFRDIAAIAGLTFKGYPGNYIPERHLQSSSRLFFNMFMNYDPHNLLYCQAYQEVLEFQLQEARMREALKRINMQRIILKEIKKPSPFSFPIMVDSLREKLSSEKFEERVKRMKLDLDE